MPWVDGEFVPQATGGRRDAVPFGQGESVKSGAFSPAIISEKAQVIQEALEERLPLLGDPMFREAFERYCATQARVWLLSEYITEKIEDEGVEAVKPYLFTELSRAESNAQKFGQDCGLDPIGFAKIAKELGWAQQLAGQGVADLAARGKALRAASNER